MQFLDGQVVVRRVGIKPADRSVPGTVREGRSISSGFHRKESVVPPRTPLTELAERLLARYDALRPAAPRRVPEASEVFERGASMFD